MAKKQNPLLELVMFDIAYVISNCDYEYSSDEKKYLNVILDRYSEDDKELLKPVSYTHLTLPTKA